MRKKFSAAILVLAFVVACAASAQKTAYDVLGVAAVAVDTGMQIYADRVVAGTVPKATQDKVKADYETYQTVMKDAKKAVDAWLALGSPAPPALFPTEKVARALSAAASVQAEVK
jgi:Skp family chaperone for outer membrane proteins